MVTGLRSKRESPSSSSSPTAAAAAVTLALPLLLALVSLGDATAAAAGYDGAVVVGVGPGPGPVALGSAETRQPQRFSAELLNLFGSFNGAAANRFQRSQINGQPIYPGPTAGKIPPPPSHTPQTGPTKYGYYNPLNRRRSPYQQNKLRSENRQRQIAALENSELLKDPAKTLEMLTVLLSKIQNAVKTETQLAKKLGVRAAQQQQGQQPGGAWPPSSSYSSPQRSPDSPAVESAGGGGGVGDGRPSPVDDPDGPEATATRQQTDPEGNQNRGTDNGDSSELRRSLCHFKLCPLWRKPWQDN